MAARAEGTEEQLPVLALALRGQSLCLPLEFVLGVPKLAWGAALGRECISSASWVDLDGPAAVCRVWEGWLGTDTTGVLIPAALGASPRQELPPWLGTGCWGAW